MQKHTKKALLASVLSLLLCVSMLVGTTFAWFTDSVTTGVNTIQSGTLDVDMVKADGSAIGDKLYFRNAQGSSDILWEPGAMFALDSFKIVNKGNLALQYALYINGLSGDAKLLEAIDFYVTIGDVAYANVLANGTALNLFNATNVKLLPNTSSEKITLWGKMKEEAGNEYQGLFIDGISITVLATQVTEENDSFDNQYDKNAAWDGVVPATKPDSLVVDTAAKLISINDPAAFAYLNTLLNESNFTANYGSKWKYSIELNCDVNLFGHEWTPIVMSNFVGFDGNGHTISNLKISSGKDKVGLFGSAGGNDLPSYYVKDLILDGASVKGGNYAGALLGSGNCVVENVIVLNATVNGGKYVGGLAGRVSSIRNSAVKNVSVVASNKTVGGLVGYCINDPGIGSAINNTVENATVTGTYNVGGMFGQAQNVTVDGNTVKNSVVISTDKLPVDASSNEVRADALAARSGFANTTIGTNTVENVTVKAMTTVKTADDLVNAFANLSVGDTIYIANDIDMTGKTIAPVTGNKSFTMLGNGNTIRNLKSTERALFVAHSGSSAYTFDGVVLEYCVVETTAEYGALFVGDGDTSDAINIKNCVVKNCTVKSAKYAAAFVGYTAGYNVVNNGPVYSDVLISNCEVIGGSITGGGSTAAAVGHSGGNVDTTTTIENLKVDGVAINGEDSEHTGIVVGTAHIGKTVIENVTYSNVTGNYNASNVLFGRFVPGTTGTLTIDGVNK